MTGKIYLSRDHRSYFGRLSQVNISTEPFLQGVGCGGGGLEITLEDIRKAIKSGYEVVFIKKENFVSQQFPLLPEDEDYIRKELNL